MSHEAVTPDRAEGPRDSAEAEVHDHPGAMTYVMIALILTVLTALEVGVFYIEALESVLALILMVLTTGKFVLVVMFYMHLKQDSKIFTGVFVAPLLLAMFLVVAMIILFNVLPNYG